MEKLLTIDGIPHDGIIDVITKYSTDCSMVRGNLSGIIDRLETAMTIKFAGISWKDIVSIDIKTGAKLLPFRESPPIYYTNGKLNLTVGKAVYIGEKQFKVKHFKYNTLLDCTKIEVE